jgi:hypothetical protein
VTSVAWNPNSLLPIVAAAVGADVVLLDASMGYGSESAAAVKEMLARGKEVPPILLSSFVCMVHTYTCVYIHMYIHIHVYMYLYMYTYIICIICIYMSYIYKKKTVRSCVYQSIVFFCRCWQGRTRTKRRAL